MEQSRIDMFMATMSDKFTPAQMLQVRTQLENVDDSKFAVLQSLDYKNPTTILIISLLGGGVGIDRFMLGQVGLGVLKLITCGGFGIWAIIDLFLVMGVARDRNFQLFMQHAY